MTILTLMRFWEIEDNKLVKQEATSQPKEQPKVYALARFIVEDKFDQVP